MSLIMLIEGRLDKKFERNEYLSEYAVLNKDIWIEDMFINKGRTIRITNIKNGEVEIEVYFETPYKKRKWIKREYICGIPNNGRISEK